MREDIKLFEAIKKGDESAFDTFFMRYYRLLCVLAERYVSADDAEEIVQNIMIWLWKNKDMLNFEGSVLNYLTRSVRNQCITLINQYELKRKVAIIWSENIENLHDNTNPYIVEELSKNIDRAIERLPETYRESFVLNRFHDMTYNEIALKLNVSSKTIDYRIQQALKLLRADLKDYL